MQGVSTFAILVLFIAQSWAFSPAIIQPCQLVENGEQEGKVVADDGSVPMSAGAKLRVFIPDSDDVNVIGSSLLFCDDQIGDVEIELADDEQSYLVTRPIDSDNDSYYVIKLVSADDPPAPPPALAYAAYRPTKAKRNRQ